MCYKGATVISGVKFKMKNWQTFNARNTAVPHFHTCVFFLEEVTGPK